MSTSTDLCLQNVVEKALPYKPYPYPRLSRITYGEQGWQDLPIEASLLLNILGFMPINEVLSRFANIDISIFDGSWHVGYDVQLRLNSNDADLHTLELPYEDGLIRSNTILRELEYNLDSRYPQYRNYDQGTQVALLGIGYFFGQEAAFDVINADKDGILDDDGEAGRFRRYQHIVDVATRSFCPENSPDRLKLVLSAMATISLA